MESSEEANTKIKVSNITRNVTIKHLEEIFGKYGTVKNATIPTDTKSKKPMAYSIIEFTTSSEAYKAILAMNGGQLDSMTLKVTLENTPTAAANTHNKRKRSRDKHSKHMQKSKSHSKSHSPKH